MPPPSAGTVSTPAHTVPPAPSSISTRPQLALSHARCSCVHICPRSPHPRPSRLSPPPRAICHVPARPPSALPCSDPRQPVPGGLLPYAYLTPSSPGAHHARTHTRVPRRGAYASVPLSSSLPPSPPSTIRRLGLSAPQPPTVHAVPFFSVDRPLLRSVPSPCSVLFFLFRSIFPFRSIFSVPL
ncbi:hypothetical protein HETIRDRAFT_455572 [Heterobasidion irregulare TC 32-1]|uniref:Uncharacterized protein n=1 Tax=Heterobasidion irregulare (strain TC 32-1) TaxID=747525 RepID=W4JQX2_HETIT|nr:uncharacterized protein HETIRDRAFT_455572 [Heterobasidion irregulare TC 32-1]ETW75938.1 hypothetical protein HETIRDRAFT_455572 [Heterobasidion irregulare TC 32-1]